MSTVSLKQWTRDEYDRLVQAGVLAPGERVQLVEGDIVRMWPQGPEHALAICNAEEELRRVFPYGFSVRVQLPFAGSPISEPEPDVAVVRGHRRDFIRDHPAEAVLVVEVSDSTLDFDRRSKAPMYARAHVPEYWIVNLVDRVVEVYRDPVPDHGYQTAVTFHPGEWIVPLVAPSSRIGVDDLLP